MMSIQIIQHTFYIRLLLFFVIPYTIHCIKIAIIGGGVGGTSVSHYLRNHSVFKDAEITIYDKNDRLGGRTSVLQFSDNNHNNNNIHNNNQSHVTIEMGASIFVPDNKLLLEMIREFNLTVESPSRLGNLAIWDGAKVIFEVTIGCALLLLF